MALFKADGTELLDADVTTNAGAGVAGEKVYTIDEEVYEDFKFDGTQTKGRRLKFHAGQKVTQKQLDEALASSKDA